MYPKSHVKSLKHSKLKRTFYRNLSIVGVFLISLLILGPLIHELVHLAWLNFQDCFYYFRPHLGAFGLSGEVEPLCHLSDTSLLIFYSTGYFSTLLTGTLLNTIAFELHDKIENHIYLLTSGTGLMLSVALGLTAKGDFATLFSVLDVEPFYGRIFTIALIVLIFVSSFKPVDIILSELERQE